MAAREPAEGVPLAYAIIGRTPQLARASRGPDQIVSPVDERQLVPSRS